MEAFVYGTLMIPEVRARLGGGHLVARSAVLREFSRHLVRGETYPSLRPASGGRVEGQVLSGLDADLLTRWDAYEGEQYERMLVAVSLHDGSDVEAWVWLLGPDHRHRLSEEPWSLELFLAHDLPTFLRDYPGWGT